MVKEILAKELKVGDKVSYVDRYFEVSFVELSENGKSVYFKYKGGDRKMRKGANSKIPLW